MTCELSIAIVLHNSADSFAACLRSIRGAVERDFAEVIAVDNVSPDDSVAILRRELPSARVIEMPSNRGFASGVNAAMAGSSSCGRYWLLLNPDVRVPSRGLEALAAFMDAHPRIGIASPELLGDDGHWESPGRAAPSIIRSLVELSRLHRLLPRSVRGRLLRGPYWCGGDQLNAGWVPGTAAIVRPEAARQTGPLCEDLFMYGEDLEWCWRMRRAGWKVGVCAQTTFVHESGTSAVRSWGYDEKERRIAAGMDAACRHMYGALHARAIAAVHALTLAAEARGPRRVSEHRVAMRRSAQIWWQLARQR